MTRILLEIPQNQDLDFLLALFKRMNIRIVQRSSEPPLSAQNDEDTALILAGLPEKKDFASFLEEFEEQWFVMIFR